MCHVEHLRPRLVRVHQPSGRHGPGQRRGQATAAGASLDHLIAGVQAEPVYDIGGVLRIDDLGATFQLLNQVGQSRRKQQGAMAGMALHGAAPRHADQLVVAQGTEMGMGGLARLQAHDIAFMIGGEEQDKVACVCQGVEHYGIWHKQ